MRKTSAGLPRLDCRCVAVRAGLIDVKGGKLTSETGVLLTSWMTESCSQSLDFPNVFAKLGLPKSNGFGAERGHVDKDLNGHWVRVGLLHQILSSEMPIVVLDAVAGMGKSTILVQVAAVLGADVHSGPLAPKPGPGISLWDVPNSSFCGALPEAFVNGKSRIIMAKRPDVIVKGIDRARAYGALFELNGHDLIFSQQELDLVMGPTLATKQLAETGGWPLLICGFKNWGPQMVGFLQSEIAAPLDHPNLVRLSLALKLGGTIPNILPRFLPETIPAQIKDNLCLAVQRELAERCATPAIAIAVAKVYEVEGHLPAAIAVYHGAGRPDLALQALRIGSADFFIHIFGTDAFDKALAGFSAEFCKVNETLTICKAMQALKHGHVPLAQRLIADGLGPAANDPVTVFEPNSNYSLSFRAFRLVMMIYEDVQLSDTLLKQIFTLLEEFPLDAHLARGSFYNAVLEFFARNRRFVEAESLALRARHHYQLAGVPVLVFYISLHRSIVRLISGDAIEALRHAQLAAAELATVPFDCASEHRLLALLLACIDYEGGKVEPLAQFLNLEFDEFSNGEIWPNLIELALYYGSLALSQHYSTLSARSFLDRWRVYQLRNPGLAAMMDLREVVVLQNGNRWQEAAERLNALPHRTTRTWVLAQTDELTRLSDRDELAGTMLWLRHLAFEGPKRPGLTDKLVAISANPFLTARQRIGVEIWAAFCHKRVRNLTAARAGLLKTLESAASLGAVAPLTEERPFLADLLDTKSIASFVDASVSVRHILRKMRDAGTIKGSADRRSGLTRQETRILQAVCEGASNKYVAHVLGLSVATVKFHLGNVYAKLGCRGRKEAIQAAVALGLVT